MNTTEALTTPRSVVLAMSQIAASQIAQEMRTIGCSVVGASSVADVDSCLAKLTGRLLVLTEISFPDGNWRDLIHRTQPQHSRTLFILCSATRTAELWWDALDCEISDILTPPYSVPDVMRMMLP